MIPDFEEQLKRKFEQASLNEVMPDFDKEDEWAQLSQRMHPSSKKRAMPMWSYAAAILLLVAVGVGWYMLKASGEQAIASSNVIIPAAPLPDAIHAPAIDTATAYEPAMAGTQNEDTARGKNKPIAITKKQDRKLNTVVSYQNPDIICNGTPCPIQICISQTMKCPGNQHMPISTCATLEPNQSVKLAYKEHHEVAKNCLLTVNEIEIKNVVTGETIVLNANSVPYTAQDVFSYITGEKKGDILAGVFNTDCKNQERQNGLRLDNSYGDLIIQQ